MGNVIQIARSYIGKVTYTWGARDPDNGKADCSGFVQSIFKKAGFSIGGTTGEIWTDENLINVAREDLQPGDLVLFKNTYNSSYEDGVSHVGIYTGNNMMIDCGSSGVQERSVDSFAKDKYLGAKRHTQATMQAGGSILSGINTGTTSSIGLEWWGDVVVVILATFLLLGGVAFLVLGVKGTVIDKITK